MWRSRPSLPIGISDFRELRRKGHYYVDKSLLIERVFATGAKVLLLPRPRRFGKTLNLSMVRYFVERSSDDRRPFFSGLQVERSEIAQEHFGRYPVIALSFKDLKEAAWTDCLAGLGGVLADCYRAHRYLLQGGRLHPEEERAFRAVLEQQASHQQLRDALRVLSRHLYEHHGQQVVVLVDEYDTPLQTAYLHGYYDEALTLLRGMLSGVLKDNDEVLAKGVLTGILRLAKESVFSGLNNLAVYSLLRPEFAPFFGFTEPEVARAADDLGCAEDLAGLREWYNGYLFGGEVIYNPWSVLNFLDSEDRQFRPYWAGSSANDLVRDLLVGGPRGLRAELDDLLRGGSIERRIEENIVLRDLGEDPLSLWGLLLFSGYLKATAVRLVDDRLHATLEVPNREVRGAFADMVQSWLAAQVGGADEVEALLRALLRGDARTVERYLSQLLKVSLSYHDTARGPERVYHGFVVRLLVSLGAEYEVRSNRESGYGRCDVMVLPRQPGRPGIVMELKTVDSEAGEDPEQALEAALRQLEERDYATELRERGAAPVITMAAAFDGKRAYVRRG